MIFKKISLAFAVLLGLVSFAPAFAQVDTSVNANVTVSLTAAETHAQTRGSQEIDRRVAALTDLNARIQAMQQVTTDFKASIATALQNQIAAFTALKAKIATDDSATLKTDIQSITDTYRIFALVLPQGRIAAAGDRTLTIVTMMGTLGNKLSARITAAGQAGNDTTALTAALNDMAAKLTDAQTQAKAAVTVSATLAPDNGDKTIMASNTAALKQARADIAASTKDLQAARKDLDTIVHGLKNMKAAASASSTTATP